VASGGVGNPGSWNRCSYVEGDPVNNIDPRGLESYPVDFLLELAGKLAAQSITVTATPQSAFEIGYIVNQYLSTAAEHRSSAEALFRQQIGEAVRGVASVIVGDVRAGAVSALKRNRNHQPCVDALEKLGVTVDQVLTGLENMRLINGDGSIAKVGELYANAADLIVLRSGTAVYANVTVGEYLDANPSTSFMAELGGNRCVLQLVYGRAVWHGVHARRSHS
jgi:hypothetical protein